MDFKTKRSKLPPDSFAVGPDVEPEPIDPIDEETWSSITSLPDDVSIRTSDNFGTDLKILWELWDVWLQMVLDVQSYVTSPPESPMSTMVLDCTDHFQSSFYNTIVGFYREGISGMRNILESLTIGSFLEHLNDPVKYKQWLNGDIEIGFGQAANYLMNQLKPFEEQIRKTLIDDLFSQRNKTWTGGLLRRLHRDICPYTHGAPGHTNGDIWQSNGPIYVESAFIQFKILFLKAFIIGFILTKLTYPQLKQITQEHYRKALVQALNGIPKKDSDYQIISESLKILF